MGFAIAMFVCYRYEWATQEEAKDISARRSCHQRIFVRPIFRQLGQ